jgi:oxygen-independent coproporphyrinogen-3 oxidase
MPDSVLFNRELINRYARTGPRYTSYPTAVQFHDGFNWEHYVRNARQTNEDLIPPSLSLYFHLPFCSRVCYYCACNKIITNNRAHAGPYLANLHQEIRMQGELFNRDRLVDQLHWGGGTPTFINHGQMQELMEITRRHFTLREDDSGDYSIEIDPREVQYQTINVLREIGFNRMSIGVQDFEPEVQKAVNRIQTPEQTCDVMEAARKAGFKSINLDLIYGLPNQTVDSFHQTLELVVRYRPDRLAVYNYAHMPHLFKSQKQIREEELPGPDEKLEIMQDTIRFLYESGYVYIGMDHFARPDDELAVAQRNGTLHRNFQGYTTHANCDLIGMGITAISKVGQCYAQNVRTLNEYEQAIRDRRIPVMRGVRLDDDDLLRRDVITRLICHFHVNYAEIEEDHHIDFNEYFYNELISLQEMEKHGLIRLQNNSITVLPAGRLLIRNICMVFDKYLRAGTGQGSYSKVI